MQLFPCTLLALGMWSTAPRSFPDEQLERLLKQIRSELDAIAPNTLYRLAARGDEESFEALLTAIGWLRSPDALESAFTAFWYFRDNAQLAQRAVVFLEDKALNASHREVRRAAVFPLSYFGARSRAAYEHVLTASKDPECRAMAIGEILDPLLKRGDEAALRLVLDNADPVDVAEREAPFQAFDPDVARPWFLSKLADRRTSVSWCLVLLDVLATDPGEDLTEIVRGFLRSKSTVLQVAAIRSLVARGEEAVARVQLERMRTSAQPHVKVEVIRILTRLSARRAEELGPWRATLHALASSSNAYDRIAAAAGFGELGDDDSLVVLESLLSDRVWKVRDAVFAIAETLRRKELLAPLIERLEVEEGLMRWRVAHTLERLTGLTLGRRAAAWKQWYLENGSTFELPSLESVLEREAQREAPKEEDATVARFYGLPVLSQRVYFVIDISGSMSEPAKGAGEDEDEPTRFDLAKQELRNLLERLPEGSRCNFVFFSDEVERWHDQLRLLDAKGRVDALEFIEAQELGGGTDIYGALLAAFEDQESDTLYLLSDGDPSMGEVTDLIQIREEVAQWNSVARVTIHCVSVGQSSKLLADLAEDSEGTYLEVGAETEKPK